MLLMLLLLMLSLPMLLLLSFPVVAVASSVSFAAFVVHHVHIPAAVLVGVASFRDV